MAASSVYTRQLLGANLLTTSASAQVPAGQVWIIRNACLCARAGTVNDGIVLTGPTGVWWGAHVLTSLAYSLYTLETRVALLAGQSISALVLAGSWDVTVTGYVFTV